MYITNFQRNAFFTCAAFPRMEVSPIRTTLPPAEFTKAEPACQGKKESEGGCSSEVRNLLGLCFRLLTSNRERCSECSWKGVDDEHR